MEDRKNRGKRGTSTQLCTSEVYSQRYDQSPLKTQVFYFQVVPLKVNWKAADLDKECEVLLVGGVKERLRTAPGSLGLRRVKLANLEQIQLRTMI